MPLIYRAQTYWLDFTSTGCHRKRNFSLPARTKTSSRTSAQFVQFAKAEVCIISGAVQATETNPTPHLRLLIVVVVHSTTFIHTLPLAVSALRATSLAPV